ncbi:hypothetical protein CRENBAI_001806 [Crenichthys baileyi]|uniref:Uncharacterized protein n=1 Tax=Crenichthys baileyi TaxID=28760 RepID=A0AAV9SFK2_9TELE
METSLDLSTKKKGKQKKKKVFPCFGILSTRIHGKQVPEWKDFKTAVHVYILQLSLYPTFAPLATMLLCFPHMSCLLMPTVSVHCFWSVSVAVYIGTTNGRLHTTVCTYILI